MIWYFSDRGYVFTCFITSEARAPSARRQQEVSARLLCCVCTHTLGPGLCSMRPLWPPWFAKPRLSCVRRRPETRGLIVGAASFSFLRAEPNRAAWGPHRPSCWGQSPGSSSSSCSADGEAREDECLLLPCGFCSKNTQFVLINTLEHQFCAWLIVLIPSGSLLRQFLRFRVLKNNTSQFTFLTVLS